jgi:hypothetical protein
VSRETFRLTLANFNDETAAAPVKLKREQINALLPTPTESRSGEVRAKVVPSVGMADLHKEIKSNVAQGATLYTDRWVAYRGLKAHSITPPLTTWPKNTLLAIATRTALNRFGRCSSAVITVFITT